MDNRAHGKSEGTYCTFGAKEKEDVTRLIDFLSANEAIHETGVWGQSLGAAIALQAMSVDKRIRYGIIESTYSDFNEITHDYMNFHLGFDWPILTEYLIWRAGIIAEFDPESVAPKLACEFIEQPVFMVHGDEDERINIRHGRTNFEHLKSAQKEFLVIENALHTTVWKEGGASYMNQVFAFISAQNK